ncbi:hypothetical protein YQE_09187, partial [Dendroctonus ponderosae]
MARMFADIKKELFILWLKVNGSSTYSQYSTALDDLNLFSRHYFFLKQKFANIKESYLQIDYSINSPIKYEFKISDEFRSKVACENERIQLKCNPHSRVAVYSASYGRTQYESIQCPQAQGVPEETELVKHQYLVNQADMKVRPVVLLNESLIWLFDGQKCLFMETASNI